MIHEVVSPIRVSLPRKTMEDKVVAINTNVFFGLHRITRNNVKQQYTYDMEEVLSGLKLNPPIEVEFRLIYGTKRKIDRMNIYAMIEKVFMDALVKWSDLPDDRDEYVSKHSFYPTKYIKGEERVEITLITAD